MSNRARTNATPMVRKLLTSWTAIPKSGSVRILVVGPNFCPRFIARFVWIFGPLRGSDSNLVRYVLDLFMADFGQKNFIPGGFFRSVVLKNFRKIQNPDRTKNHEILVRSGFQKNEKISGLKKNKSWSILEFGNSNFWKNRKFDWTKSTGNFRS